MMPQNYSFAPLQECLTLALRMSHLYFHHLDQGRPDSGKYTIPEERFPNLF
jgi:hypothetical protein